MNQYEIYSWLQIFIDFLLDKWIQNNNLIRFFLLDKLVQLISLVNEYKSNSSLIIMKEGRNQIDPLEEEFWENDVHPKTH